MTQKSVKKVLIAAPTADKKNYCLQEWYNNVLNFKHPNIEIFLSDNSKTIKNTNYLRSLGINADWVKPTGKGIIHTMAQSHNQCREYAIAHNFEWWLHLETDVFPPDDIIERLMCHNKEVCGAAYHSYDGVNRALVQQRAFEYSEGDGRFQVLRADSNTADTFMDGTLKSVYHIGLGALLIHRNVFSQIPFRSQQGEDLHPDSYFANDCFKNGIEIFCDTSAICIHKNSNWGEYGVDYK